MRILLTGGGTGGHIYPALALYRYLIDTNKKRFDFLYVGTSQGLESQIIPRENIPFQTVNSGGLSRNFSVNNIVALTKVVKGMGQSLRILREFRPQVVVGTGGYVCGPVVLMASLMGIPTVIHEQNAFPGVTNKILARFVQRICLTFPEAEKYFGKYKSKIRITGLPIRPQILRIGRNEAMEALGLDKRKLTLLVVGGSRGAKKINQAMISVVEEFKDHNNIQIIIATGQTGYEEFCSDLKKREMMIKKLANVIVKPYLNEMEYGLGAADLVIGRAGAAFLAEITALGIPSILIPYPFATENHQEYNAMAVVNAGGGLMIKDKDLNGELLVTRINKLISEPAMLKEMGSKAKALGQPNAGEKLAEVALNIAK